MIRLFTQLDAKSFTDWAGLTVARLALRSSAWREGCFDAAPQPGHGPTSTSCTTEAPGTPGSPVVDLKFKRINE